MSLKMFGVFRALPQQGARCFSSLPASPFDDFRVRVKSYNHETFKLETLSAIRPHRAGGWSVDCYDHDVANDVRQALQAATKAYGLKVFNEGKGTFRVEAVDPEAAAHTSWKQARRTQGKAGPLYQDNYLTDAVVDNVLLDAFTPQANRLQARLGKTWVPVDTKQAARRSRQRAMKQALENQAASAAMELGYSDSLVGRVQRMASGKKKAMRQLLKQVTAAAFDEPPTPVWT
jgi:hypothetical protein